jgi:hypothetical protein
MRGAHNSERSRASWPLSRSPSQKAAARSYDAASEMIEMHVAHGLHGIEWEPACEYCVTRRPRG